MEETQESNNGTSPGFESLAEWRAISSAERARTTGANGRGETYSASSQLLSFSAMSEAMSEVIECLRKLCKHLTLRKRFVGYKNVLKSEKSVIIESDAARFVYERN